MSGIQSNTLKFVMLACIVAGSQTAHAAKLYKWADEVGNIHYSESPPTDRNTEEVSSDSTHGADAAVPDTTPVEIPQPVNPQASQQLAERCQGLYRELESYISGQQVTDSEGNAIIVSAEMREAKITEIKAELDQSCR